jgi:hypothetical protein
VSSLKHNIQRATTMTRGIPVYRKQLLHDIPTQQGSQRGEGAIAADTAAAAVAEATLALGR